MRLLSHSFHLSVNKTKCFSLVSRALRFFFCVYVCLFSFFFCFTYHVSLQIHIFVSCFCFLFACWHRLSHPPVGRNGHKFWSDTKMTFYLIRCSKEQSHFTSRHSQYLLSIQIDDALRFEIPVSAPLICSENALLLPPQNSFWKWREGKNENLNWFATWLHKEINC